METPARKGESLTGAYRNGQTTLSDASTASETPVSVLYRDEDAVLALDSSHSGDDFGIPVGYGLWYGHVQLIDSSRAHPGPTDLCRDASDRDGHRHLCRERGEEDLTDRRRRPRRPEPRPVEFHDVTRLCGPG